MSDVILTEQSAPASPGATKHAVYVDGTTKKLASKDSAGSVVDYMALVAPSTAGNVLTSDGNEWVSNPPANRNAIINGTMDIWQRGTATLTNPANGTYFPDRFITIHGLGDGTFNLLQSAETPMANFPFMHSLQHDTTHIETAVAAGEYSLLVYRMEGYDFKRFEGNTATLSFWVKAVKTGIYCVSFQNNAGDKSYVSEYTVNASNTWEKKTITLTFNSGGTFLYTNGVGLHIRWGVMLGSTYQTGTPNTWVAGSYGATANQVNGMDNVANNFYLTGVQLELGSVATPFEFRPYQQELALCQRYCYAINSGAYETICSITGRDATTASAMYPLKTVMRITPVLSSVVATGYQLSDEVNAAINTTAIALSALSNSSPYCVNLYCSAASGITAYRNYIFRTDETDGRLMVFSAEL